MGISTYEPDLDASLLAATRHTWCGGSDHPIRGTISADVLEVDVSGHVPFTCRYASSLYPRYLTLHHSARPARDLVDYVASLSNERLQHVTLVLQPCVSFHASLINIVALSTERIELVTTAPVPVELWPDQSGQQEEHLPHFQGYVHASFAQVTLEGGTGGTGRQRSAAILSYVVSRVCLLLSPERDGMPC